MKTIKRWFLNLLWRIQFKKMKYTGLRGYHCRECHGGDGEMWCGSFYCPCKPDEKLDWRFTENSKVFNNLIKYTIKWRISI